MSIDYVIEDNTLIIGNVNEIQELNTGGGNTPWYQESISTITKVKFINTVNGVGNLQNLFKGFSALQSIDFSNFYTTEVTSMESMFEDCTSLTVLNLIGLSGKSLTDLSSFVKGCTNLTSIDLSSLFAFTYSVVTDVTNIFNDCSSLKYVNFGNADLSHCTSYENMFLNCELIEIINLETVNMFGTTASVAGMFSGCAELETIYVSKNLDLSEVTFSNTTFSGCTTLLDNYWGSNTRPEDATSNKYAKVSNGYFKTTDIVLETNNVIPESIGWIKDNHKITILQSIQVPSASVASLIQDVTKYGTAFGGIYDTTKNWYGVQHFSPVFFNNAFPRYDWDVGQSVNLNGSYAFGYVTSTGTEINLNMPTGHIWRQTKAEKKIWNMSVVIRVNGGYLRMWSKSTIENGKRHGYSNSQYLPIGSRSISIIKDGVIDTFSKQQPDPNDNNYYWYFSDTDFTSIELYQQGLSNHIQIKLPLHNGGTPTHLPNDSTSANNYPIVAYFSTLEIKIQPLPQS